MRVFKLKFYNKNVIFDDLAQILEEVKLFLTETNDPIQVVAVEISEEQYLAIPEDEGW